MGSSVLLFPMGHVALASRSWRRRGRSLLTVIVKGTFDLHQDSPMTIAQPAPIVVDERVLQNNPVASLLRASDLALVVPKPEVVLVGSAFAAAGGRATVTTVRLTVQRDRTILIDKQLEVVGDLLTGAGVAARAPEPFARMPIQYERALGGMMSRENPIGRGMEPDGKGVVFQPNILLTKSGGEKPAGFGPISSVWPARRALRGSLQAAAANTQLDVDLPDDLQDGYFQTAPADQRVDGLVGGELITLVNLHPQHQTLRTYLPALQGVALLESARGERVPLQLRMDTVHLEPESMRAEILYRGIMDVTREQLEHLRIAGALETPDRRFVFPALSTLHATPQASPQQRPVVSHAGTQLIQPTSPRAPSPGQAQNAPPLVGGNAQFAGTMVLEEDSAPAPRLPFTGQRPVPPAPPPPVGFIPTANPNAHSAARLNVPTPAAAVATMFVDSDQTAQSLPFPKGQAGGRERPVVTPSKDATPWSEAQKLAPVKSAAGVFSTHLADALEAPPAPAAPPAAPPPPGEAPADSASAAGRDSSKSPWRVDPASEAVVVTPPAAPKPALAPRTDVKGGLYKKLKR